MHSLSCLQRKKTLLFATLAQSSKAFRNALHRLSFFMLIFAIAWLYLRAVLISILSMVD